MVDTICTGSDMHPYNCDGPGRCDHCDGSYKHKRTCLLCSCSRAPWNAPHPEHQTQYVCGGCGLFFCPQSKTARGGHRVSYGLWGNYRCRGTLYRWRTGSERLEAVRRAAYARMRAKQPRGDAILQAVGE